MKTRTLSPHEYLFVRWLSDNHPGLLAAAERRIEAGGNLGALTDSINAMLNAVNRGLETYVKGKESVALVKLNVQRAKQGLPPLTDAGQPFEVSEADMQTRRMPGLSGTAWVVLGLIVLYVATRD